MRKAFLTLLVVCMTLVLASGAALAVVRNGGPGGDLLVGTKGSDFIDGKRGDDTISASGGPDFLLGGFGDDVINGGAGDDFLDGSGLKCDIDICKDIGDRGSDTLSGGRGSDDLSGGRGSDILSGGPGDDFLSDPGLGSRGNTISGGDGNDFIQSVAEGRKPVEDKIICGDGRDEVEADHKDLIAGDCERVARFRRGEG